MGHTEKTYQSLLSFEKATIEQAEYLTQLALDSHAHWGYRTCSDEVSRKVLGTKPEHFDLNQHYLAKEGDTVIGMFGLTKDRDENGKEVNELVHFFLQPKYIGKGYGRLLFEECVRRAKEELHWNSFELDSDWHAKEFYQKMGCVWIGESPSLLHSDYIVPRLKYVFSDS